MTDLVAFLRARLDEDEAAAKAATSAPWGCQVFHRGTDHAEWVVTGSTGSQAVLTGAVGVGWMAGMPHDGEHIALHDPARELREVQAKRRLIDRYRDAVAARESDDDPWLQALFDQILDECAVYSDHPDYDQEGRP